MSEASLAMRTHIVRIGERFRDYLHNAYVALYLGERRYGPHRGDNVPSLLDIVLDKLQSDTAGLVTSRPAIQHFAHPRFAPVMRTVGILAGVMGEGSGVDPSWEF